MNKTIKENRYNVHPAVLSCFLHLRLKEELGVRASDTTADKQNPGSKLYSRSKESSRRAKGKPTTQPHLSKKARKAFKERLGIQKEFREAEAKVDKEERTKMQTETLKLVFVLYFSILKDPHSTPLLVEALRGISKFAHLVNVDFFKDLMKVLKDIMAWSSANVFICDNELSKNLRRILQCIVTAFELLTGQGEALNLDLGDFVSGLYAIIFPLAFAIDVDLSPLSSLSDRNRSVKMEPMADVMFYALDLVFSPRSPVGAAPSVRSASFAKRLLSTSLNWPPNAVLRTLDFVERLVKRDSMLEVMLSTEDRTPDGVYRGDLDDPQLSHPFGTSFYELYILRQSHYDARVRDKAASLLKSVRT